MALVSRLTINTVGDNIVNTIVIEGVDIVISIIIVVKIVEVIKVVEVETINGAKIEVELLEVIDVVDKLLT